MIYIYALVNPENNKPFYVGQTSDPKTRLKQHTGKRPSTNGENREIIQLLKSKGLLPKMVILEVFDGDLEIGQPSTAAELIWIDTLKCHGLTNNLQSRRFQFNFGGYVPRLVANISDRHKQICRTWDLFEYDKKSLKGMLSAKELDDDTKLFGHSVLKCVFKPTIT